jgi:hypothetical protein
VGVAALVAFGVALFVALKKMALTIRAEASRAALIGFVVIGAMWFLLGSPLNDKGLSFGVILLLALALADSQDSVPGPRDRRVRNSAKSSAVRHSIIREPFRFGTIAARQGSEIAAVRSV